MARCSTHTTGGYPHFTGGASVREFENLHTWLKCTSISPHKSQDAPSESIHQTLPKCWTPCTTLLLDLEGRYIVQVLFHKLFVTLDILLEMQSHTQQGEPVTNCCHAYIEAAGLSGEQLHLSSQEQVYMEQKLYNGYFAFEALSEHNWDSGVCGICGVAPVFESGDGNAKNCTPLRKGEVSTKNFRLQQ